MSFFSRRLKKPMSRQEANQRMQALETEKGDIPAMIIAAFLVFLPAVLLAVGAIVGLSWLFLFR